MNKKKILIIIFSVLLVIVIGVCIFSIVNKPDEEDFSIDGIELPKNESVLKDETVGDFKITNVSLLTREGISSFRARVYNDTDNDLSIKMLSVVFYEDGVETSTIALMDANISAGTYAYISIESEKDLSGVDKIEYVLE